MSKTLLVIAALCAFLAMLVRFTPFDYILPARMLPVNWLKLADTFALFSIAISILKLNRK